MKIEPAKSRSARFALDSPPIGQNALSIIARHGLFRPSLMLAEAVIQRLIRPERTYILRFGESDAHMHFHVIPRTAEVLSKYLQSDIDAPPYNGARIAASIWANYSCEGQVEEIHAFIAAARNVCIELCPVGGID